MNQHEQLQFIADQVNEIAARSRRTETCLHKVREHLGIASGKDQVQVLGINDVEVQGYDVTLSQIVKVLKEDGSLLPADKVVVRNKNGIIAVIAFSLTEL